MLPPLLEDQTCVTYCNINMHQENLQLIFAGLNQGQFWGTGCSYGNRVTLKRHGWLHPLGCLGRRCHCRTIDREDASEMSELGGG